MTVSNAAFRNQYTGNGATATYDYSFKVLANADLKVVITTDAGVETTSTLDGVGTYDYTVTGAGNAAGGTITLNTNLPTGFLVTIIPDPDSTQNTSLTDGQGLPASQVENALDRNVLLVKKLEEAQSRNVQLSEGSSGTVSRTLPNITNKAGQFLVVNSTADGFDVDEVVNTTAASSLVFTTSNYGDDTITAAKIADDAVTSAKIADDAVTSAKLGDLSGLTSATVTLTDTIPFTDVDDSNNTKKTTVQGIVDLVPVSGGTWEVISSQTASSDSQIVVTSGILSTYNLMRLRLHGVRGATDDQEFQLTFSNDGGATYETANYINGSTFFNFSSEVRMTGGTSSIHLTQDQGNQPLEYADAVLYIYNAPDAGLPTRINGIVTAIHSSGNPYTIVINSIYNVAETINGIRLAYSSGNIATGQIILEGWGS